MSGHKRALVSISPEEFRQLHEADMRLRVLDRDFQDVKDRLLASRLDEFDESYSQLEARQQSFHQDISNLDEQIKSAELRNTQNLLDRTAYLHQHINSMGDSLWTQTSTLLKEQSNQLSNLLTESLIEQEAAFNQMRSSIELMNRKRESQAILADRTLQAAQAMLASIIQTYDYDRLAPGRIEDLQGELEIARNNFEAEMFEACLVNSQHICRRVSAMRIFFEDQIFQSEVLYAIVNEKANFLFEQMNNSHLVPAIDLQGNELGTDVDVDFWTQGQFKVLVYRIKSLIKHLEENRYKFDLAELEQIQQILLPELETKLNELVFQARLQVISSQIRYNIAQYVVDALREQGFEPENGDYLGLDMRQSYQANLRDLEGSQVVIRVDPPDQFIESQALHVFSLDRELRSEHEIRQRALEVKRSLSSRGLVVGPLEIEQGTTEEGIPVGENQSINRKQQVSQTRIQHNEYQPD